MTWRGRITATVLALGVLAYAGGASALADAYFEVHTFVEWEDALLTGNVVPISPVNWDIYMDEWAMYTEEGDPYPPNEFRPATLYAYEGPDFERAGLVMAWGEDDPPAGDYATAWEWDYLVDPDLSNAVVTMTVYPPSYLGGGGITQISFGIRDINGNSRSWRWNVPGTIPWDVGTPVTVDCSKTGVNATSPVADAYMNNPAFDITQAQFLIADENGQLIGGPLPVPPAGGPAGAIWNYWYDVTVKPKSYGQYAFEFSLDIGSDTELSDPFMDGDEVFDPGDVYWWKGAVFPNPTNGFKDDVRIFGYDPDPDPLIPTRVPVGMGTIQDYYDYFDLDGHDQLDVDLREWIPPEQHLTWPIPQFTSNCIYTVDHLMISYEDDQAPGWPANDVPVTASSPAGFIRGMSGANDEILGVDVGPVVGMPPYPVMMSYPIADEVTVHQSMFPNPDAGDIDDDDVDSLDIVPHEDECPEWYFSPDHEAHLGLDPGGIYLVLSPGFVQVVDEFIHLGIPEDTDIDAFEFVWIEDQNVAGALSLAVAYSVDDDDPLTLGVDESGGLDPKMIYASYMTGWSFPLLMNPLDDDVDALTAWLESLEEEQTEACCLPDGTCLDVTATDCINNYGGMPMGPGTTCATLPPTIIVDPAGVAACENDNVTLSVTVCGAAPMVYQWYKDGAILFGETNPTLILLDIRPADAGAYYVDVSNPYGGPISSATANVTVQAKADANCDGFVDNFDIDAFVLALTGGQAAWEAVYTCEYFCANDINRDGGVDNFDIDPFVACVLAGGCP